MSEWVRNWWRRWFGTRADRPYYALIAKRVERAAGRIAWEVIALAALILLVYWLWSGEIDEPGLVALLVGLWLVAVVIGHAAVRAPAELFHEAADDAARAAGTAAARIAELERRIAEADAHEEDHRWFNDAVTRADNSIYYAQRNVTMRGPTTTEPEAVQAMAAAIKNQLSLIADGMRERGFAGEADRFQEAVDRIAGATRKDVLAATNQALENLMRQAVEPRRLPLQDR
jgi:hypothetical protein